MMTNSNDTYVCDIELMTHLIDVHVNGLTSFGMSNCMTKHDSNDYQSSVFQFYVEQRNFVSSKTEKRKKGTKT